jgi:Flp pilus assembly protein TadG
MKQTQRREGGQAMVEFALVIPLLVLVLMGIVDLGQGVYAYNVVASGAREGARFGVLDPTNTNGIKSQALANTAGLNPQPTAANVDVKCSNNGTTFTPAPCSTSNTFIRVSVGHTYQPLTIFFATLPFTGTSMMAIEP